MITKTDRDIRQQQSFTPTQLRAEFRVTARALRFYEDKGLLNPTRRGTARDYSRRDRVRLGLILKGKRFGFTLTEIKKLLNTYSSEDNGAAQRSLVLKKLDQQGDYLRQQIVDMSAALEELAETRNELSGVQLDVQDLRADAAGNAEGRRVRESHRPEASISQDAAGH